MVKLLVIADDFTGALDTGVQFKARGTVIQIWDGAGTELFTMADRTTQVLVLDAETRHMLPAQAHAAVKYIVECAVAVGIPYIYKKTDSALRGNIGSELDAMLEASGQPRLHFIPSFPRMGRTTVDGVHFIDGVPVAESIFGADPFEPVQYSAVRDIIASQTEVETHLVDSMAERSMPNGVLIHSAASDEELSRIAAGLKEQDQLHFLAGCAGLASVLPAVLELAESDRRLPVFDRRLLTVCGSINPITRRQLDAAERMGAERICLTPRQMLDPAWLESGEGLRCVQQWLHRIRECSSAIVDCNCAGDLQATRRYAAGQGITLEYARCTVADAIGGILKRLLDMGLESTLLVTGGDTLMAFMRRIGQNQLCPICELAPGVVLSQIRYQNKRYNLISKSGGFGTETLIVRLEEFIIRNSGAAFAGQNLRLKEICVC